jgi:hypothetical protein
MFLLTVTAFISFVLGALATILAGIIYEKKYGSLKQEYFRCNNCGHFDDIQLQPMEGFGVHSSNPKICLRCGHNKFTPVFLKVYKR